VRRTLPALALLLVCLTALAQDKPAAEGVITGRLLDQTAKPMPGVRLRARIVRYTEGHAVLADVSLGSTTTNDRGDYRLFGLPAGEYYLIIGVVRETRATSFYYPGTQDLADAEVIRLKKGSEFRAADFRLPALLTSGAKITGVINSEFELRQPPSLSGASVRSPDMEAYLALVKAYNEAKTASVGALIPRDKRVMETNPFALEVPNTAPDRNRNFQLQNVPNGAYDLVFVDRSANVQSEPISIDVRNKDLLDLPVRIRRVEVTGQISLKGNATAMPLAAITVELQPVHRFYTLPPVTVGSAGGFTMSNLSSGLYALVLSGLPPDAYVADVRVGGRSVKPAEFVLPGGKQEFEIVLDPSGASIDGVAEDGSKQAVAGAQVVLIPASLNQGDKSPYRIAIADNAGAFLLRGLPPGEYRVLAWEPILATGDISEELVRQNQDRGETVRLSSGGREHVNPRVNQRIE